MSCRCPYPVGTERGGAKTSTWSGASCGRMGGTVAAPMNDFAFNNPDSSGTSWQRNLASKTAPSRCGPRAEQAGVRQECERRRARLRRGKCFGAEDEVEGTARKIQILHLVLVRRRNDRGGAFRQRARSPARSSAHPFARTDQRHHEQPDALHQILT